MTATSRLAAAGVVGTVVATLATALLWAAAPSVQAHHRPDHGSPKPSPSASPSSSPSPTASPSPSPSQSPFTAPVGGCSGTITFGNSNSCAFDYRGGDVHLAATTTQVTLTCHFFFSSCGVDLFGAGVDLLSSDGRVLTSCYTGTLPPGGSGLSTPSCAVTASLDGVPVGTVLTCRGYTPSTGTFSCASARKP